MISVSVLTALGRTDAQCCLTAGLSQVPGPARTRSAAGRGLCASHSPTQPHAGGGGASCRLPQSGFHVKHEFVDLDLRSG